MTFTTKITGTYLAYQETAADEALPVDVIAISESVSFVLEQTPRWQDADHTVLVESTAAHITRTLAAGLPDDSKSAYVQVQDLARECRAVPCSASSSTYRTPGRCTYRGRGGALASTGSRPVESGE